MPPQTHDNQAATTTGPDSEFQYEANDRWAKLPPGWVWTEVAAVAADSQDRVYVFNRGEHPVMIFDRDGTFLRAWGVPTMNSGGAPVSDPASSALNGSRRIGDRRSGSREEDIFARPHGIFIGPDD